MKQKSEENHAKEQAEAQLKSVREFVKALAKSKHSDEAREAILNDALSVEVRSGWHCLSNGALKPKEYKILLCTGGPAVQIVGELNEYLEPETARIQYQDWFTPWTDLPITEDDESSLLKYAACFYFGE